MNVTTDEVLEIANTIMCDTRQDLCGRGPLNQMNELDDGFDQWARSQGWDDYSLLHEVTSPEFHKYMVGVIAIRYLCVKAWIYDFFDIQKARELDTRVYELVNSYFSFENNQELFSLISSHFPNCGFTLHGRGYSILLSNNAEQIMKYFKADLESMSGYQPSSEVFGFFLSRFQGFLDFMGLLQSGFELEKQRDANMEHAKSGCIRWLCIIGSIALILYFI